jgi:Arc/MetJ-type ribon-helix-helix transcriptional regulator
MDTLQIRLGKALVERIDTLVKTGVYGSRSDAIREAVRHFFWHQEVGTMKSRGEGVLLVRKAREKLSRKKISLAEINRY